MKPLLESQGEGISRVSHDSNDLDLQSSKSNQQTTCVLDSRNRNEYATEILKWIDAFTHEQRSNVLLVAIRWARALGVGK